MKSLLLIISLISVQVFAGENRVYWLAESSVGDGVESAKVWFNERDLQLTLDFDKMGTKVLPAKVTKVNKSYCGNSYYASYRFNRSIVWEIEVTDYDADPVLCEIIITNDVKVQITERNNQKVTQSTTLMFDRPHGVVKPLQQQ